jgi:hypothetical protein
MNDTGLIHPIVAMQVQPDVPMEVGEEMPYMSQSYSALLSIFGVPYEYGRKCVC